MNDKMTKLQNDSEPFLPIIGHNYPGETEYNYEKLHSGKSVSRARFEPIDS
jgi:hypothetical protein